MTKRNTGPVAVITGASSGVGAATARALAGHGYRLTLNEILLRPTSQPG